MRRALLLCLALIALSGTSEAAAQTVPTDEHARIHALTAPYDYLPATLPPGLIYINWATFGPAGYPASCGQILFTNPVSK